MNFCSFVSIFEGKPRIYTALAVKYSSKLDIFGFAEVLFHSLEIKVHFYSLVYTNFCSFVSIFEDKPRIYPALAVKNIEVNFMFFARLLVYLQSEVTKKV